MARTKENTPLATLSRPTAQQFFDTVVAYAATMRIRSVIERGEDNAFCMYRGPDENACFIGNMLTDEEADGLDQRIGDKSVRSLTHSRALPRRFMDQTALLTSLQNVHDNHEIKRWKGKLYEVAEDYGLDAEVIEIHFGRAA